MTRERVVRSLRLAYFAYLALLPMLAAAGLSVVGNGYRSAWVLALIGAFLGVTVYLGVVIEVVPFPKTLGGALFAIALVPAQTGLAVWLTGETLWFFFVYEFVVYSVGLLSGIIAYAVASRTLGLKEWLTALILLAGPALALGLLFVPPLLAPDHGSLASRFFLGTALVSSLVTNYRRVRYGERSDDLWPLIIVGIFAWFLGPVLPDLIAALKDATFEILSS